jgi:hypothetical protein
LERLKLPNPENGQIHRKTNMKEIPLSQGKTALVDDADYERVSQFKWSAFKTKKGRTFYACRTVYLPDGRSTNQLMHRFILGLTDPSERTDHRDHNGLNNRRHNLRVCTHRQNQCNILKRDRKFKGITLDRRFGGYDARITINGVQKHLGRFQRAEDAAAAYNLAAIKYFGQFCCLNQLPARKANTPVYRSYYSKRILVEVAAAA